VNILIVDDQDLVVDLIKLYIEQGSLDATVQTARDLGVTIDLIKRDPSIDIVLLDMAMTGIDRADGLQRVASARLGLPVAILSDSDDPVDMIAAMAAGAAGYVPKTLTPSALLTVVKLILLGERYVPWSHAERLIATFRGDPGAFPQPMAERKDLPSFSPREREVLALLLLGKSNKEIGLDLNLQEGTIKINLRRIYRKLGVKTRLQAVRRVQP
jgi:two-component system, NarL family, nitrate/nitrite response regulator NarL